MSNYIRAHIKGGIYFFTVVSHDRQPILTDEKNILILRNAFNKVKATFPFTMSAIVVLPDHIHCIWQLPANDNNFSTRWRLIKNYFSREINAIKNKRHEKLVWQRRFWEHLIKDESDFEKHMDYIHYNPVKHGYTKSPADWPFSSFREMINRGFYDLTWGSHAPESIIDMDIE